MPGSIGPMELVLLAVVVLLVFGPKRLPEMGRSLGKGLREFKDSISGTGASLDAASETPASSAGPRAAGGLARTSSAPGERDDLD